MTEKERELLKAWLLSEDFRRDSDIKELQQRLRYRRIDVVDCIELALCLERYSSFLEFRNTVEKLLSLVGDNNG